MQHQPDSLPNTSPMRLKCIVLGSSGAGKTTFLRRYFHGTFEGNRFSTKCADFYSCIIPNPRYQKSTDLTSIQNIPQDRRDGTEKCVSTSSSAMVTNSIYDKKKKTKKKINGTKNSEGAIVTGEVGSVDRKRRKRRKHSNKKGCRRTTRQERLNEYAYRPSIALQMWDTAGKERLISESTGLTSRLGDAFFRHANVAILMYDATSSRSFLQLIKWYSELLERVDRVQRNSSGSSGVGSSNSSYRGRFPVLVVASKLDMLTSEEASRVARKKHVPQRHVMGLQTFKGMNYYYEYGDANGGRIKYGSRDSLRMQEKRDTQLRKASSNVNEDRMTLSYGLESHSWASDKSYLHYIRIAEDACYPDRKMVLRWCARNNLHHVEVSALENIGIDDAIENAVILALQRTDEQKKMKVTANSNHHSTEHADLNNNSYQKQLQHDECAFCKFLIQALRRKL